MRLYDAAAIAIGFALLAALERVPVAGPLAAGLAVGLLARGPAKGFFEAVAAGMIFAVAFTAMAAAGLPLAAVRPTGAYEYGFVFYYDYVADSVICAVGGFIGGIVARGLRAHSSTGVPSPEASADS